MNVSHTGSDFASQKTFPHVVVVVGGVTYQLVLHTMNSFMYWTCTALVVLS